MSETIDPDALAARARTLHANAKNGTLRLPSGQYVFTFDHYAGVYDVTCKDDADFTLRLNTRKIAEARKLLREYVGE